MVLGDRAMKALAAAVILPLLPVAALVMACGSAATVDEAPILPLPELSAIAKIQASIEGQRDSGVRKTDGFSGVLQLLGDLDSGWELTTESASGYLVSASMSTADNTILLVLWIGDDWLGAYDMESKVHVRQPLVDPHREALLRSLGIGLGSGADFEAANP